jgi:hypothetical protein
MRSVPAIALALVACGAGTEERDVPLETQTGQALVGAWDARLAISQPYQLALHEPAARRICGTIGFVDNRYGNPESVRTDKPHMGVYDMDLSLLGLDWLDNQSFPIAVASVVDAHTPRAGTARDSVRIVLNPGGQEKIILRGLYDVAEISGAWTAQSPRGTASGSFWMTPHLNARASAPSCD